MNDPYRVLGVARGAGLDEIKRAYRRRAKALHPDVNAGDEAAAERFRDLQRAYEMLTDPTGIPAGTARWEFAGGMTADDDGRGGNPADLFGDIAGNRRGRVSGAASTSMNVPGDDMAFPLRISETEAAEGTTRTLDLVTGRRVTVEVMAGAKAGDVITMPGLGFPGLGGGGPGNLNVIIEIAPAPEIGRKDEPP